MSQAALVDVVERAWEARFPVWRSYALSLTRDPHDAEEVVQEAVTRTLRAEPCLESELDAHRYILTAVKTAALQLLRSRQRYNGLGEVELEGRGRIRSSPLRLLLHRESTEREREMVEAAKAHLDGLRPEQRQAVELLVLAEPPMKLREVSEIQDAPISTVHSRLEAALGHLAEAVRRSVEGHEGPDGD